MILVSISCVSIVVFIAFSKHGEDEDRDHWHDGSDWLQRRDNGDALQYRDKHEVAISESEELIK